MPITVNYTPVPAVTQLAKQAGQQAGKKWQAEYQQPFALDQQRIEAQNKLQTQQDANIFERLKYSTVAASEAQKSDQQAAMERLGLDTASSLERLNLQIGSSERLNTADNQTQLEQINLNNQAAMERLQAGDVNTYERLKTQIDADTQNLNTKISAESQMAADERASQLERLVTQISSNEKLQTSENIQRLKEIDANNKSAMERLQAGDFNTAQRLFAQIDSDFKKLDMTISADERLLAEKNKAQLEAIYIGDYNTAQRLQTQIDADLKKTDSTQQFERELTYRRAELERQMLRTNNQYDLQRLGYEKQLVEQSQMNLLSATYDFNTQFETTKYQQSRQKEYDTIQQNKDEYDFMSKEIDDNYTLTDEQKTTAKMIARSKIMGYGGGGLDYTDLGQETASDQIRRLTAENTAIKNQAYIDRQYAMTEQGDVRLKQGQQKIEQGDVRLEQNQQKIDDARNNAKQQLDSIEYRYNTLSPYQQQQLLAKSPIVEKDGIYYIRYTDSITGQPDYDPIDENSSLVRQFKNLQNRTFEQSTPLPSGNQVNIRGTGENKKYTVTYPNQTGQSQSTEKIIVIAPNGQRGLIPKTRLNDYLSNGYKLAQ